MLHNLYMWKRKISLSDLTFQKFGLKHVGMSTVLKGDWGNECPKLVAH